MVKGISKQVIVVRAPDAKLFEEAIFIVRADALGREGVTDADVLREAAQAAGGYVRCHTRGGRAAGLQLLPVLYAAGGGLLVGMAWLLTLLML